MAITKNTLENLSMDDLLDLKDKVDQRIQAMALNEIEALESKMAQLRPLAGKKRSGGGAARGKAPVKFRDPKSGKAWSGRGMTPVWLREYEEKGVNREKFAV